MATVKINTKSTLTFTERMRAEAARKRGMARRRLVTCVTATVIVITGFLSFCAHRDEARRPVEISIVKQTRARAEYAAAVNGWDVYIVPEERR